MLLPLISLSAIFLPAISLPTISLLTISHPAISLPRYFTSHYFTPRYFTSRYFTSHYFTSHYFTPVISLPVISPPAISPPAISLPAISLPAIFLPAISLPAISPPIIFPQSFPHLLIPYRHGLSCHLFFNLFFFSPFTFIFSSLVIFFRATSLSAILLSSSHKIPFSYSHLHFPSHKTALNIFPLPNPSEIPSPIFILLPAIHTAPAITAKRASQYINADPSPIFHQQIFPSAPGY